MYAYIAVIRVNTAGAEQPVLTAVWSMHNVQYLDHNFQD